MKRARPELGLLLGAGVLAAAVAAGVLTRSWLWFAFVASGGVALYPAYRAGGDRRWDPFAPINFFVLYLVLTVYVRAGVILAGRSPILGPLYPSGGGELAGFLTGALLITGLFLLALYVGYYGRVGPSIAAVVPPMAPTEVTRSQVVAAICVAGALSVPAAALLVARIGGSVAVGRFTIETRAGGIFWMGYLVRLAAYGALIPLAAELTRSTEGRANRRAVLALAGALAVFAIWPKKIVLASQLLAVLVSYHYLRRPIRVRVLAAAALAGALVLPLLSAFRHWGFEALAPQRLLTFAQLAVTDPSLLLRDLINRSFGADSIVLILDELHRRSDLALGGTLRDVTWWFVPRALWAGKPVTYAISFGQEFLARSGFFSANVSGTPTVVGELLLNFGVPGVVVGGWLCGVLLRAPYDYLVARRASVASVLLFATFLAGSVMVVEGPIAPQLIDLVVALSSVALLVVVLEFTARAGRVWSLGRPLARP